MNILIFAGTTEGRSLAQYLGRQQIFCHVCVATEYGEELIEPSRYLTIHTGRLTADEMEELMKRENIDFVVDATHPYAVEVSENIRAACRTTGTPYVRLHREESQSRMPGCIVAENTEEAAEYAASCEGNVLLTTGSKEAPLFARQERLRERLYLRMLPVPDAIRECEKLGIPASHLCCMQGPFSQEMNLALLHQWGIRVLVTKESGKAGGFPEKLEAARKANVKVIVIGRPRETVGMSFEQVKEKLWKEYL